MILIVGLGNPGETYARNRHNVGVMVVNSLVSGLNQRYKKREAMSERSTMKILQASVSDFQPKVVVAYPLLFMNDSGLAVKKLVDRYQIKPDKLFIVHDDLDIRFGEFKIQKGKGPKLHNGLISIEEAVGTGDFWRVRVGVDNRKTDSRIPGEVYVLLNFEQHEIKKLERTIQKVVEKLYAIISK